jgi:hypothetical protein
MTPENKRLFKFWAKNFGSFLAWLVGGVAIGIALLAMPAWLIPYAAISLLLLVGAHTSLMFARNDMKLDEMKQRRVIEALAREPRD